MAGMTLQGFQIKRLPEIKEEIETALRQVLGNGINLLPTELLGQIIGIVSEREALMWEGLLSVYNAFYPETANGISLDNVVSITGIKRLEATRGTGQGLAYGILGTVITDGSVVSVAGNPEARFVVDGDFTIAAGTNEVQTISFTAVPDAGSWSLVFDGEETSPMAFNANAAAVQSAINALSALSAVSVSGNYASGFAVTFAGADGQVNQPLFRIGANTLTNTSVLVGVSIIETTQGVLPNVLVDLVAESAGEIHAPAGSITVIESPISGWESFVNNLDVTPGNNIETDADLRIRRNKTLATAGATTVDAIRSRILEIDEVEDARVFENDTDIADIFGRPPHSIEAVVLGGDNQEIIDTIWATKAAGIRAYGDISGTSLDSMARPHTVQFSRPSEIDVYVIVNLTVDSNFPVDGVAAVQAAIVEYAEENFGIGDDVITVQLFCPVVDIEGILDCVILIGTAPAPGTDNNIAINDDEIAVFDTSRVTVNT